MMPPFEIDGGLGLALGRAASVAGLIGAFGSLLYLAAISPAGLPVLVRAQLGRIAWVWLAAAAAGAVLWLLLQTQDLAEGLAPGDIWAVLGGTRYGHLLAGRLAALASSALLLRLRRERLAACVAGFALALQAGHSHAAAMQGGDLLLVVAVLHLLAAGAWLGGLVPLLAVIRLAPERFAAGAAARFSRLGMGCVLVLLATSTLQFRYWIGNLPALFGTAYGWVAGVKMVLFAGLVALAARHRLGLTPRLPATRLALARSIGAELGLGLAVICAAGILTELQPSMHVQTYWPFAWVPSFAVVAEDPDYRTEAAWAVAALVLAAAMLIASWVLRARFRLALAGAACAVAVAMFAVPHFAPLLVPAEPTLFFHSPSGFTAASIGRGAALYAERCAACHGPAGHGDGPAAHGLAIPPADLTAAHLWMHRDGQLYWWIGHGIEDAEGGLAMPGFPGLSDGDRWALIDYLHANNAGLAFAGGLWARPLHAPDFPLACLDGRISRLSDLRGTPVRLVVGAPAAAAPGVVTVEARAGGTPEAGLCVAAPDGVQDAYGIATGRRGSAPIQDGGAAFLIDAEGWLRLERPAGELADGQILAAAVARMLASRPPPPGMAAGMPPGMVMKGM